MTKIAMKIVAIYFVLGFLTFLDWELVWLKNAPEYGQWGRTNSTIIFGPIIVATWPVQWVAFYRLGAWSWLPARSRPG